MDIALIRISEPDSAPSWLENTMPLEMKAIRQFDSDDGSQYILAELLTAINAPHCEVTYLVVGGRMIGAPLTGGVGGTPANVAYVKDMTLLNDEKIDFSKAEFAAITLASCTPKTPKVVSNSKSEFWKFWK